MLRSSSRPRFLFWLDDGQAFHPLYMDSSKLLLSLAFSKHSIDLLRLIPIAYGFLPLSLATWVSATQHLHQSARPSNPPMELFSLPSYDDQSTLDKIKIASSAAAVSISLIPFLDKALSTAGKNG